MNRLKELRLNAHESQEYVGTLIGVSGQAVGQYEAEKRDLSPDKILKLAEHYDCTTDYLLGKSYYKNYEDFKKIDEFVLNYKRTPEETKIVCDALNYTNTHPNETFEKILEKFTSNVPMDKKELFKSIISHLHYRYHGKLPAQQNSNNFDGQNNIFSTNEFIKIPVVGKIAAGQPILAEEYLEGYLPVDPNIYGITTPEDYFYLKVAGQSMNLKVKNGDYALIHKQDYAENGDIIVAIVNGDEEATLKKFKKLNEQFVLLEPMSSDPTIEAITVDLRDTNFKIIGKAIGQFGKF